jgi:hypothetical protein
LAGEPPRKPPNRDSLDLIQVNCRARWKRAASRAILVKIKFHGVQEA